MSVKDLRASTLALRAHTRTLLSSIETLDQQLLVEQNCDDKAENKLQAALELIKDQQDFITSLRYRNLHTNPESVQEWEALDARASTFTFVSNFPIKKESGQHEQPERQ